MFEELLKDPKLQVAAAGFVLAAIDVFTGWIKNSTVARQSLLLKFIAKVCQAANER